MKKSKIIFRCLIGAVIPLVVANIICHFYFSNPGTATLSNGITRWVWDAHGKYINMYEGYGVTVFDKNGYNNRDKELGDSYVLMMGSSHGGGTHVAEQYRMNNVLNDLLDVGDDRLHVYNTSIAGHYLPDLCKGFKCATEVFPDASAIVLEIFKTSYTPDELEQAFPQREYDNDMVKKQIEKSMTSTKGKIKRGVMTYFPLFGELRFKQFLTWKLTFGNCFGLNNNSDNSDSEIDLEQYENDMNDILSVIRSEYDKPIIVLYHPYIYLDKKGKMQIVEEDTTETFMKLCEKNDIDFLDTSDRFIEEYENDYTVPYGFSNTVIGQGHLNIDGHRIMAELLYEELNKLGVNE